MKLLKNSIHHHSIAIINARLRKLFRKSSKKNIVELKPKTDIFDNISSSDYEYHFTANGTISNCLVLYHGMY